MTQRPPLPGDFGVVLVCNCRDRHAPLYAVRHVSRADAERIAADLALSNGHDFMIVLSNGLDLHDRSDYYRPASTTSTNTR